MNIDKGKIKTMNDRGKKIPAPPPPPPVRTQAATSPGLQHLPTPAPGNTATEDPLQTLAQELVFLASFPQDMLRNQKT